jgi:hypothetical protein
VKWISGSYTVLKMAVLHKLVAALTLLSGLFILYLGRQVRQSITDLVGSQPGQNEGQV